MVQGREGSSIVREAHQGEWVTPLSCVNSLTCRWTRKHRGRCSYSAGFVLSPSSFSLRFLFVRQCRTHSGGVFHFQLTSQELCSKACTELGLGDSNSRKKSWQQRLTITWMETSVNGPYGKIWKF